MTEGKTKYNVYLGRFCPLHKGHEAIINSIVEKHGKENLLIMIGSSTSHNKRTPYTYEERAKMIRMIYPDAKIVGLPDSEPNKIFFREHTINEWLKSIKEVESEMNGEFKFFGGSVEDLSDLSKEFDTEVIVDRNEGPEKISATKVREAFESGDIKKAKSMISESTYSLVAPKSDETLRKV